MHPSRPAPGRPLLLMTMVAVLLAGALTGPWIACSHHATTSRPGCGARPSSSVAVVLMSPAGPAQHLAARYLVESLSRLYPDERFILNGEWQSSPRRICLATTGTLPARLANRLDQPLPDRPESYLLACVNADGHQVGLVVGADGAGMAYGVFGLLERLGCGFYLSFDALPASRRGRMDLAVFHGRNTPLARRRIAFNWHNFLSGCTAWEPVHWRQWIRQTWKMGFNSIMVHAYGNNPMAGFSFRQQVKPVGYLGSTHLGRSWFVNHVNDVRRMAGGRLFDRPVFGAPAAVGGPYEQRIAAARNMMGPVFAYAHRCGMKVIFGIDVDTLAANPPELVQRLDRADRFPVRGGLWLANPETPGGYAFYKAQVAALLQAYPHLDTLSLWHRMNRNTPWLGIDYSQLPPAWQRQFDDLRPGQPPVGNWGRAPAIFAISKIVVACQKAVRQLGRPDVQIAFSTWYYDTVDTHHHFMPPDVPFYLIDVSPLWSRPYVDQPAGRRVLARIAAQRTIVPLLWAHDDDGQYVYRSYRPVDRFAEKLQLSRCAEHGYGILHWMTRPLDLFFASYAHQVWSASANQPIGRTAGQLAGHLFGPEARSLGSDYLLQWLDQAPLFARETSDWFIDRPLPRPQDIAPACQRRLALLDRIEQTAGDNPQARRWVGYFRGIERFGFQVHQAEDHFRQAHALAYAGQRRAAARHIAQADPVAVIEQLAQTLERTGPTRGELGLLVTLNTRWRPHYLRLRQHLGLAPIGYQFGPTVHDPYAQRPGRYTFYFDTTGRLWQTLGRAETSAPTYRLAPDLPVTAESDDLAPAKEWVGQGIIVSRTLHLSLRPIMHRADPWRKDIHLVPTVPAGRYRLTLWMLGRDEDDSAGAIRLEVRGGDKRVLARREELDWKRKDWQVRAVSADLILPVAAEPRLTVEPVGGTIRLGAVQLQPLPPGSR